MSELSVAVDRAAVTAFHAAHGGNQPLPDGSFAGARLLGKTRGVSDVLCLHRLIDEAFNPQQNCLQTQLPFPIVFSLLELRDSGDAEIALTVRSAELLGANLIAGEPVTSYRYLLWPHHPQPASAAESELDLVEALERLATDFTALVAALARLRR